LEVRDGLVYRRAEGKPGEQAVLQLLVPRRIIQEVIRTSHEGQTGGHFGVKRTLDQVKRRFYWSTWKADTVRFFRRCPNCNEYFRGKLVRQGPLQPVIVGTQKSWFGEAPATEVIELQSENTEFANGVEEVNEPEESLPTDGTEAAYAIDDAPPPN